MYNPIRWLERKFLTGEVIYDYGEIIRNGTGFSGSSCSLLLCRKAGKEILILRQKKYYFCGLALSYVEIPIEEAEMIGGIFLDAASKIKGSTKPTG